MANEKIRLVGKEEFDSHKNSSNPHGATASDVGAVQQGGGIGQGDNKIHIGWDGNSRTLRATVDNTDIGGFLFNGGVDLATLPVSKGGTGASTPETARANIGAVHANETSEFNFTNKGLNTINIDEVFNYNYVTALTSEGSGTIPYSETGWVNVMNFCSTHFVTQLAVSCRLTTVAKRTIITWIRERHSGGGWSDWKILYTPDTIGASPDDITVGSYPMMHGEIYQMYE